MNIRTDRHGTAGQRPAVDVDLDLLAGSLFAAVVSDVLDSMGLREQALAGGLRQFSGDAERTLIGWARTIRAAPVDAVPAQPYAELIGLTDSLRPGDVIVADCSGSSAALWGELFSSASLGRGARGAVIDGMVRDVRRMRPLGFPVFAAGTQPTDSLGRLEVGGYDVPVRVRGVPVHSGDLVVADEDGVVVVPAARAAEAIELAGAKVGIEGDAMRQLADGAGIGEVWERFGVL
jgi:4-hydroxy-4-methyl-2-oxoglutarate aldolase